MSENGPDLKELKNVLMGGSDADVKRVVANYLDNGVDAVTLINSIQICMREVGILFDRGKIFLPQILMTSAGIESAMELIMPQLESDEVSAPKNKIVVIGTVEGDTHDIGKNICTVLLRIAGYEVHDLGRDVPATSFIKEIKNGAEYCGMSSLMTTTMMVLKNVIDNLQENDIRNGVVVMVGGAPVTQAFADKIGADIYSETAFEMMKKIGNEESSGSH